MSIPSQDRQGEDLPAAGSDVTLMPSRGTGRYGGAMRTWTRSAHGLVVTSAVGVEPGVAQKLNGLRVWISTRTAATGSLAVFEAVAQRSRDDELTMTGVMQMAREPRREAVRAASALPIQLRGAGRSVQTTTVDISRSGVRLALDPSDEVAARDTLEVSVRLDGGAQVHARGNVVRVAAAGDEAVIRFIDIDDADGERLDREVFAHLAAGRGEAAGSSG